MPYDANSQIAQILGYSVRELPDETWVFCSCDGNPSTEPPRATEDDAWYDAPDWVSDFENVMCLWKGVPGLRVEIISDKGIVVTYRQGLRLVERFEETEIVTVTTRLAGMWLKYIGPTYKAQNEE